MKFNNNNNNTNFAPQKGIGTVPLENKWSDFPWVMLHMPGSWKPRLLLIQKKVVTTQKPFFFSPLLLLPLFCCYSHFSDNQFQVFHTWYSTKKSGKWVNGAGSKGKHWSRHEEAAGVGKSPSLPRSSLPVPCQHVSSRPIAPANTWACCHLLPFFKRKSILKTKHPRNWGVGKMDEEGQKVHNTHA